MSLLVRCAKCYHVVAVKQNQASTTHISYNSGGFCDVKKKVEVGTFDKDCLAKLNASVWSGPHKKSYFSAKEGPQRLQALCNIHSIAGQLIHSKAGYSIDWQDQKRISGQSH